MPPFWGQMLCWFLHCYNGHLFNISAVKGVRSFADDKILLLERKQTHLCSVHGPLQLPQFVELANLI